MEDRANSYGRPEFNKIQWKNDFQSYAAKRRAFDLILVKAHATILQEILENWKMGNTTT